MLEKANKGIATATSLPSSSVQTFPSSSRSGDPTTPPMAWDPHKPTFYFLPATAVLSARGQLGRMQELRDSFQLVKLPIDLNDAFEGKGLIRYVLFVSHRWEDPVTPDETGAQLRAIQAHLGASPTANVASPSQNVGQSRRRCNS